MTILHSGIKQVVATSMIAFLVSCGSEPKKTESPVDSTALMQDSQILEAVEDLFTKLPKPSTIPNLIAMTGAEYETELLNPAANAEKVMGNSSKAAFSVGVYSADLGYMAAYDKGQQAIQTFVVGKKLADKIGVSSAFDASVLERIEKNLAQKDSLITISDASIANSSGILKANDQIKDAALLTAGAFIEGLYLTCGLIHDYPPTGLPKAEQDKILVPLVNAVIKQEGALSSLIELLQKVNDKDEVVTSIIAGLEKSKAIYAKANWAERIANNKGDLIPTENDIKELAKSIAELRKGMVE